VSNGVQEEETLLAKIQEWGKNLKNTRKSFQICKQEEDLARFFKNQEDYFDFQDC
jgi:hypothetical protein